MAAMPDNLKKGNIMTEVSEVRLKVIKNINGGTSVVRADKPKHTPGDKVEIIDAVSGGFIKCVWWPKGKVTGTVQKVFKNGKVAVAIHQLRQDDNGDGLKTLHFKSSAIAKAEGR